MVYAVAAHIAIAVMEQRCKFNHSHSVHHALSHSRENNFVRVCDHFSVKGKKDTPCLIFIFPNQS
jgi:hypothetical protein